MPTGYAIGRGIPPAPVDAPNPGPETPFGLFSAAKIIESPPRHELNGVEYEPVCNVHVDEWPLDCTAYRDVDPDKDAARDPEPMPHPKGPDEGPERPYGRKIFRHGKSVSSAAPFAVYAGEPCFLGNHDEKQALADLRERFKLGEQAAVERVVYDGLMGVMPAIRYRPWVLNTGLENPEGPVPLMDGIGILEHWLTRDSGSTGVIHAPRYMAPVLGGNEAPGETNGGPRAMTPLGSAYAFGTGYSGAAPFGDDGPIEEFPDKVWLYATRSVTVRRSSVIEPADYKTGAVSLPRNESSLLIERVYVVDWPCEVAAIQIDFPRYEISARSVDDPPPEPQAPPEGPPEGEPGDEKPGEQPDEQEQ